MIDEIIARLEANKEALGLKLVAGAAQFQVAAESNPPATPAAYVLPLDESPQPNEWEGVVLQRVAEVAGIVLVVRNVADPKGGAARVDLKALRSAVKAVLYGWQPTADREVLERGRCTLLAFRDGHMWWQDTYASAYFDRSPL